MKILVVDDDEFIHRVIAAHLAAEGHDLLHAFSSAEAHATIKQAGPVDVLITDIVMPVTDGTQLIRELHATMPLLPVVAMTGGIENAKDDYVQLAEFFADCTITKPLRKNDLCHAISTAIRYAQTRNAPPKAEAEEPINSLQRLLNAYNL